MYIDMRDVMSSPSKRYLRRNGTRVPNRPAVRYSARRPSGNHLWLAHYIHHLNTQPPKTLCTCYRATTSLKISSEVKSLRLSLQPITTTACAQDS